MTAGGKGDGRKTNARVYDEGYAYLGAFRNVRDEIEFRVRALLQDELA